MPEAERLILARDPLARLGIADQRRGPGTFPIGTIPNGWVIVQLSIRIYRARNGELDAQLLHRDRVHVHDDSLRACGQGALGSECVQPGEQGLRSLEREDDLISIGVAQALDRRRPRL